MQNELQTDVNCVIFFFLIFLALKRAVLIKERGPGVS
jgi:hypothetical protein